MFLRGPRNYLISVICTLSLTGCNGGGGGGGASESGSLSGGGAASASFSARIADYKDLYGKSDAWAAWMTANASRYNQVFAASSSRPAVINISFKYDTAPLLYSPDWVDENEHMSVFTKVLEGAFAGYNFNLQYNGNTGTSYANITAGIPVNASYQFGKNVYLYYETIINHEFGHVMHLLHHYDNIGEVGDGNHMPPGDTKCIMDRNSLTFCSACRTALGIPLDPYDTTDMEDAMDDILDRYPY